ncbi:MAG: cytochrome c oxidase subunit, partial [Solirubrobacteraceae bacterium]|nr:cytochrome c oxidase subunit [Solirubrobacteraceae bacterium]
MSTAAPTAGHRLPPLMRSPSLFRALEFTALGVGFSFGLSALLRWAYHLHPVLNAAAAAPIILLATPLFFLVGLGAFDYWFYWAAGKPTRPEDHSSHGARSWKDYFRVNTDHKVIGTQYVVTSFFFLFVGGLLA